MKKKIIKSILTLLLSVVCMAGCGTNENAGAAETPAEDVQSEQLQKTAGADDSENTAEKENNGDGTESAHEVTEEIVEDVNAEEPVIFDNLEERIYDTVYPSTAGALQVIGTQLCSADGEPVQLRGVSTHGIQWFPEYINQDLFNELHSNWNVNVVRLAMYITESEGYGTDGDKEALKELMGQGIEYASEADLYAIVDWHSMRDGDPTEYEEDSIAFFDEISSKYADYDNVIYEICNEPNTVTWAVIREYAMNVIPVIRANDPDAVILIGTPIYCKAPDEPAKDPITEYDNIMYTCHFYAASHHESIQNELKAALADGLPIFVSEFGICANTGAGSLDTEWGDSWITLCNENGVSYVCWQLSNKSESSSLLSEDCTKTNGFTEDDLSEHGRWLMETYSR